MNGYGRAKWCMLGIILLLVGCINMKPYNNFNTYMDVGRPDKAEALVDSMLNAKLYKYGKERERGANPDTSVGFELAHWAMFYRLCGAYAKSEYNDSLAAVYLGRGYNKRHPEYLSARHDQAYVMLLRGKRAEALATMKEVRDVLMSAPEAGKPEVDLHDLFEFYFRAEEMGELKRVVKRGLAHTQPMYRPDPNEEFEAIIGSPDLWHFNKVKKEHIYDFDMYLRHAMMYNHSLPDPIWSEHYLLVEKALNEWYDGSPRNKNNVDLGYALSIGGTGRSTRALEITKRAYRDMGKLTGLRTVDYAVGATNYASIYMDYAMNNCVEVPFVYLDSIYTADCDKLNGKDDDAIRQYLNCQCGQSLLRTYAGTMDSAAVSMGRARAAWRALRMEHKRPEQFAGRYATYAATLFEVSLAQGALQRCDSILRVARSAPLTRGALKHKILFMEAKLAIQRNEHAAAAKALGPVRAFVDEYRRMGTMPFSVSNSRDMLGAYESADALDLTALLGMGGQELRIRSILDSRKLNVMREQMDAFRTHRQGYASPAFEQTFAQWKLLRQELSDIVTDPRATPRSRDRARQLEDTLYIKEMTLSVLHRDWTADLKKQAKKGLDEYSVEAALGPTSAALDIHRVHLYDTLLKNYVPVYLLMVRRKEGPPTVVRVDDADRIDHLVRLVNELHTADKNSDQAITDLSEALVAPVQTALNKVQRLYVCGDGGLSLLNWAYLWDGKKRLGETRQLHHVHGMEALRRKEITGYFPYVEDAAFFGDPVFFSTGLGTLAEPIDTAFVRPGQRDFENGKGLKALPNTRVEIQESARIVMEAPLVQVRQRNVKSYLGYDVWENQFKQIGPVNLLHIATHGYFEQDQADLMRMYRLNDTLSTIARDPMLMSGLLLNGSGDHLQGTGGRKQENGLLSAAEIADMDLSKAELVVLSACLSGQGSVATADGVDGLQRGFFIAGAKAVMVSYWKVDDTFTTMFMKEFYKRWSSKEPHADAALRSTQLHFMAQKEYASPRYWASFAIISR